MKTKKLANFQIYISAPLNVCPGNVNEKKQCLIRLLNSA